MLYPWMFLSHLADTLVVKLAQLWEYMSLVVPVMSSHWAGAVPPAEGLHFFIKSFFFFSTNTIWNELAESIFIPVSLSRQDTSLFQPFPSSLAGQLHQIWPRLEKTGVQDNLPFSKTQISISDNVFFEIDQNRTVPITLQRRRRLVVSPSPASRALSLQDGGKGIRSPIGRWNLRRRGSTVTTGLNVAWFPNCRVSSSSGIGWAWVETREEEKDTKIHKSVIP